jgi:hypothetical protein
MLVRYLWAAPATLIGIALAVAAGVVGARVRFVDGSIEVAGGRIGRTISLLPRRWRFVAITFGHVIIGIDHRTLAVVRRHEHAHVRQYERFGILFFPLYIGSSLFQLLLRRDPYHDNFFEREACARSGEARWIMR